MTKLTHMHLAHLRYGEAKDVELGGVVFCVLQRSDAPISTTRITLIV